MKKNFVIVIVALIVLVLFSSNVMKKSIPSSPPNIIIIYNQNKIETAQGDYNWLITKWLEIQVWLILLIIY